MNNPEQQMRINKYLSSCGIASRRKSDILIEKGKISVNGNIITKPGILINPEKDVVRYQGKQVDLEEKVYYKLNKPQGYITAVSDDRNRKTVMDFFSDINYSVFPCGRLDRDTSGLLIFTNNGELANRLMHPRYKIEKIYEVGVDRVLNQSALKKLCHGIKLEEGVTSECVVEVTYKDKSGMELLMILKQGWKRQIRRMIESVGANVTHLRRTFIGPVGLQSLKPGQKKKLSSKELKALKRLTGL